MEHTGKTDDSIRRILKGIRHFVLDMDGTFYLGEKILPGSLSFLDALRSTGRDFLFFTNNSSKTGEAYIHKLAGMDCHIGPGQIMTSGDVTIEYLKTRQNGKSVYLLAVPVVRDSFLSAGIKLTDVSPDLVVLAFDQTLTFDKLAKACSFIRSGVPFIATHPDINCPVEGGYIPDVGAMIALIQASTGCPYPRVLGKPNKDTVEMVCSRTGWDKSEIAFVGDRIYTDVATGVNNGANGILVLSGEADMDTVKSSSVVPTLIFDELSSMNEYL